MWKIKRKVDSREWEKNGYKSNITPCNKSEYEMNPSVWCFKQIEVLVKNLIGTDSLIFLSCCFT